LLPHKRFAGFGETQCTPILPLRRLNFAASIGTLIFAPRERDFQRELYAANDILKNICGSQWLRSRGGLPEPPMKFRSRRNAACWADLCQ